MGNMGNNKPPRNKTKKIKYLQKKVSNRTGENGFVIYIFDIALHPRHIWCRNLWQRCRGRRVTVRCQSLRAQSPMDKGLDLQNTPYFEGTAVVKGQMKELKVTDYRGKYLVFFFYPLAFTFVCPTEILAFNDRIEEFRALNAEVVACSVDSHFTQLAWTNVPRKEGGLGPLNIPLLADITHKISKDYGVYLEDNGHSLRGLFIIDDKGVLRQITMNDLPVGRSVDETLRLLQAFQHTDKHGEVCPADWTPGKATIIPDPK